MQWNIMNHKDYSMHKMQCTWKDYIKCNKKIDTENTVFCKDALYIQCEVTMQLKVVVPLIVFC